jgi:Aspartyl protease
MRVPFEYLSHLVVVPVALNGVETQFILDSGIGLTLVRDRAAAVPTGETFTGKRMSGQAVTLELARAERVEFGGFAVENAEVGLLDMSGFPRELDHIGGFLSLAYFAETPVTVDYPAQTVYVGGTDGVSVEVEVVHDGPAVSVQLPLTLPTGDPVSVEVDMGSDCLILDERFAALGAGERRVVEGIDETGHAYTRTFATLPGRIHVTGAPELAQDDVPVMFQKIVYDGLIGTQFLRDYAVTFDVPGSRLVLA